MPACGRHRLAASHLSPSTSRERPQRQRQRRRALRRTAWCCMRTATTTRSNFTTCTGFGRIISEGSRNADRISAGEGRLNRITDGQIRDEDRRLQSAIRRCQRWVCAVMAVFRPLPRLMARLRAPRNLLHPLPFHGEQARQRHCPGRHWQRHRVRNRRVVRRIGVS
jgi:hypothetical protein